MHSVSTYVVSPRERAFFERLLRLSPKGAGPGEPKKTTTQENLPQIDQYDNGLKASLRLGTRVLVGGSLAITTIDLLRSRLKRSSSHGGKKKTPWSLPLTFSVILLLHRLVYRTSLHLQTRLSTLPKDGPSRVQRSIREFFVSPVGRSFAAAISGAALMILPAGDARLTISIYVFARALEYLSNALSISRRTPWWFGSWLMFPFSTAQLFHAFLNNSGTVPFIYKVAFMTFPSASTSGLRGQAPLSTEEITSRASEVAVLNFPSFYSPILFPKRLSTKHSSLDYAVRSAHPAIEQLSCALMHPRTTSCLQAYTSYIVSQFGKNSQVLFAIYSLLAIPKLRSGGKLSLALLPNVLMKALRSSIFMSLTIASAWSSTCYLQKILPKRFMKDNIYRMSGFIGGLFAFFDRESSHALFLDAARNGAISFGKSNRKIAASLDILLFMASIATLNILYDVKPSSITSKVVRKLIGFLRQPILPNEPAYKDHSESAQEVEFGDESSH